VAIAAVIGTTGVFAETFGLFTLSFLLGMIAPPLVVMLADMAKASRAKAH
jgi:hypothetical protein